MRRWSRIVIFSAALAALSCGAQKPATPVETFKTYIKALQKKDTAAMRVLLSQATIKMHEQEAKAQDVTVDEVMKRETLLGEGQTTVEYRNQKIDGDKAELQYKTSFGSWETLPFVREDGVWKIDKQSYAEQMIKDSDESKRKIDALINGNSAQPEY